MKAAALAVALLALLGAAFWWLQRPPAGPIEPVWDKTACSACAMHVGEPAFAAQWHAMDGSVHYFDDPGCLLLYWREAKEEPRDAWFHHHRQERWIPADQTAFVRVDGSPMGFNLGAVGATEGPADFDLTAARRFAEELF